MQIGRLASRLINVNAVSLQLEAKQKVKRVESVEVDFAPGKGRPKSLCGCGEITRIAELTPQHSYGALPFPMYLSVLS